MARKTNPIDRRWLLHLRAGFDTRDAGTGASRKPIQVDWREPKLFIIYVVDENGKQSASFSPVIDGLIQGPNAMFALLKQYLKQLDIQDADQLLDLL